MLRRSMAAGMLLLVPTAAWRAQFTVRSTPAICSRDRPARDLPASANVFSILETSQEQISSDRFYRAGVAVGDSRR
jgi:hypothetical protein